MDKPGYDFGSAEAGRAGFPVALAAFNGVVSVLYFLAGQGQLDEDSLKSIQYGMSRSLTTSDVDGDNEVLAALRQSLETTFADLKNYAGPRAPNA